MERPGSQHGGNSDRGGGKGGLLFPGFLATWRDIAHLTAPDAATGREIRREGGESPRDREEEAIL